MGSPKHTISLPLLPTLIILAGLNDAVEAFSGFPGTCARESCADDQFSCLLGWDLADESVRARPFRFMKTATTKIVTTLADESLRGGRPARTILIHKHCINMKLINNPYKHESVRGEEADPLAPT
jgi:hypothetical protein